MPFLRRTRHRRPPPAAPVHMRVDGVHPGTRFCPYCGHATPVTGVMVTGFARVWVTPLLPVELLPAFAECCGTCGWRHGGRT